MRWTMGALAAVLSVFACDVEDAGPTTQVPLEDAVAMITDGFCERQLSCDCAQTRYVDLNSCQADAMNLVDELSREAELLGLAYQPECIGGWLDRLAANGCAAPRVEQVERCEPWCSPFAGDLVEGNVCDSNYFGMSPCAPGLICGEMNRCVRPCDDWEATTNAGAGEDCSGGTRCADELRCNENQRCEALPLAGESCPVGQCASSATCEVVDPADQNTWTCVPLAANGEGCSGHSQCVSGYCPAARCDALPKLGQPCPANACADGAECYEGTCERPQAAVCQQSVPNGVF